MSLPGTALCLSLFPCLFLCVSFSLPLSLSLFRFLSLSLSVSLSQCPCLAPVHFKQTCISLSHYMPREQTLSTSNGLNVWKSRAGGVVRANRGATTILVANDAHLAFCPNRRSSITGSSPATLNVDMPLATLIPPPLPLQTHLATTRVFV